MASDILGDAKWNTDAGSDVINAVAGTNLVLGQLLRSDPNSSDFLNPLRRHLLAQAPVKHLVSVAGTRSGKGVSLIIPNLLCYAGPAVVIDPKGENAWVTAERRRSWPGSRTIIVDPWDEVNRTYGRPAGETETVARFNPLSILDPDSEEFADDVAYLAEALIVTKGENPYWDDSARDLVGGLIAFVMEDPTLRREASLGMVHALLLEKGGTIKDVAKVAQGLGDASVAAGKLARFAADDFHEMRSILSSAITQTMFLQSEILLRSLAATDFSFDELLTGTATIYLVLPEERLDTHGAWLRLMVSVALRAIKRGGAAARAPDRLPVLFILDEFGTVGKMPEVARAYGLMAGMGMRIWIFVQDFTQLKLYYGDAWETFVANAQALTCFAVTDEFTAEYVSKRIGDTTIEYTTTSFSEGGNQGSSSGGGSWNNSSGSSWNKSTSFNVAARRLLPAAQISRMRSDLSLVIGNHYPYVCRRIVHHDDYPFCIWARPDPKYGPLGKQRAQAKRKGVRLGIATVGEALTALQQYGVLDVQKMRDGSYVLSSIKRQLAVLKDEADLVRWARAFIGTHHIRRPAVPMEVEAVMKARLRGWEVARSSPGGLVARATDGTNRAFADADGFIAWAQSELS